jgi:iron complex outermembrane receptor protein
MGTPDRKMVSDVQSTTYGARLESKFAFGKNTFYTGLDTKCF